jgi:hypothetical protein
LKSGVKIRWAQEFIQYLVDQAHFILATHSPTIVADLPMECVIGLKNEEGAIKQYLPEERTLGGGADDLLREVFQLKSLHSDFTKQLYIKVDELFNSGDENLIAEAKRIFDDLSVSVEKHQIFSKYRRYLTD